MMMLKFSASTLTCVVFVSGCGDDVGASSGTGGSSGAAMSSTTPTTGVGPGTTSGTGVSTSGASVTGGTSGGSTGPVDPTAVTTGTTGPGMGATTGPMECVDGAEQCEAGVHELCEGGVFVEQPCAGGEYCEEVSGTCVACVCSPGGTGACVDGGLETCKADCSGLEPVACLNGQVCVDAMCQQVICTPDTKECVDNESFQVCNASGTEWEAPVACDPGKVCEQGECITTCAKAALTKSNVGCEFWAVDMTNLPPRDKFVFAVSVSNPSFDTPTNVEIFDRNNNNAEQKIVSGQVPPRQVKVFNLSGSSNGQMGYYPGDAGILGSGIVKGRGFRVVSDQPVVAVQFNPIGGALGYTTDASLLLPTHTLGKAYLHLAWDKGYGDGSTMVIMGTENATKVTITPKVNTPAGAGGLPAMMAGKPSDVMIDRYDFIQVTPGNNELSGTSVSSTAPVAVFGGHSCGNVPNTSVTACDHVEEQIFPLETWGKNYVAARNPKRGVEPMLWRILAAEDNTTVTFDPPTMLGPQVAMSKGQMVEFQEQGDFYMSATNPILVAGYMLGCSSTMAPNCPGDPYMLLMVPVEQYQADYVFLVDSSYTADHAKLVRTTGAKINVGCLGVVAENRWTKIGNSGYDWAVINMNPGEANCKPGTNEAAGDSAFGVFVSGTATAASYAYPGGLALKPINPQ